MGFNVRLPLSGRALQRYAVLCIPPNNQETFFAKKPKIFLTDPQSRGYTIFNNKRARVEKTHIFFQKYPYIFSKDTHISFHSDMGIFSRRPISFFVQLYRLSQSVCCRSFRNSTAVKVSYMKEQCHPSDFSCPDPVPIRL